MNKTEKTGSVTEAALTRSLTMSVIGIILCMVCLTGTTWAWYSSSVTSGENVIVGPYFDVDVAVVDGSAKPDADGVYSFSGGTHTVKLTGEGTAENGFCQIIATDLGSPAGTTYYAAGLSGGGSVSLEVEGSGTLKITPMIGTAPTGNGIPKDGIELLPDAPQPSDDPQPPEPVIDQKPTGEESPEKINSEITETPEVPPEETPEPVPETPTEEKA